MFFSLFYCFFVCFFLFHLFDSCFLLIRSGLTFSCFGLTVLMILLNLKLKVHHENKLWLLHKLFESMNKWKTIATNKTKKKPFCCWEEIDLWIKRKETITTFFDYTLVSFDHCAVDFSFSLVQITSIIHFDFFSLVFTPHITNQCVYM